MICCLYLFLLHVLFRGAFCLTEISCRNDDGEPVDWFIVYKLPKHKMEDVGSGVDYMYLDSSVTSWQLSRFIVNTSLGAIASTLRPLYQGKEYRSNSSAYVLYNDAPPELDYLKDYGHTKGALHFDQSQGFWLIHSIPHFPPFPEAGYGYPSTGKMFGQTALCVTYRYGQFPQIAQQLAYYNPRVYNCSMPVAFRSEGSYLAQLCDGTKPPLATKRRLEKLTSAKGERFLSFAKSQLYVDDIYTGWVAQALKTDLLVETWQRQHQLPSNCSLPSHVLNVKMVTLPGPVTFQSYHDHSKWCVSLGSRNQWTCLGDLNRGSGQVWRGGGLVCSLNPIIYKAFRQAVAWFIGC